MSDLSKEKDRLISGIEAYHKVMGKRIEELRHLLEMAKIVGHVSDMNHQLIQNEIDLIMHAMQRIVDIKTTENLIKGQSIHTPDRKIPQTNTNKTVSVTYERNKGQSMSDSKYVRGPSTPSITNNDRKEAIRDRLKDGVEMSVKELAGLFPSVSEKTIQRDVVSLMKQGIISRRGDKRWAKYFLSKKAV
jgi:DNA-binding transcriptional ArsR family regulator